ncbi:hypothetical protein PAAG_01497 [Paracoccidioides lutzii Pb01]|uniref:RRM domain-containing protein n=1 Tax=Paracoccidioides lutzii (strain ATCC MYA-826 / Pb01) TaxID=502779 RepID=C1GSK2_PARBA|nr:hypothetical protein PAAG_01497 [Paracoccidioides lutzii Pb01]EEH39035.1 hypothetical protein PAAG_01497 [Paracoccidioides lutzii Pb01]
MPSRSPSPSRGRSPSPAHSRGRRRSHSPVASRSSRRSHSRRSHVSLSRSRSRSRSRTPGPGLSPRRNGHRDASRSPSRSRSPTRSLSRGRSDRRYRDRSYTRSPSRGTPPRTSSKIVVEKLTKNVNENHLREIFGVYGEIQNLELPMNPQFMTNRGTAYILYYEAADAEAAISHMHEAQLDGAVLNVSIVLPRRTFSRSPPPARNRADFGRFDRPAYGGRGYNRTSGLDTGRAPPPGRYRSPPPRRGSPRRFQGPRGMERHDLYRPRSASRSRSPHGRSPSYSSRSRSRSPLPRRRPYPRDSPPRRRRRDSSYSSYSDRNRSRSRSRSLSRSRSPSRTRYGGGRR